jgi:uncharacterized protein
VTAALLLTACASSAGSTARVVPSTSVADATTVTTVTSATTGVDGPVSSSTNAPTDPSPVPVDTVPPVPPEGFDTALARVTLPDGSTCDLCVWLADTASQRARGLMFVTELGPADAMAFRYPEPHTGTFWMKNTVLPLSIAFYSPDGAFMEAFDMAPCTADPCPSYRTARGFSIAVEVPQGELEALGLVEGSTLDVLDLPCTP